LSSKPNDMTSSTGAATTAVRAWTCSGLAPGVWRTNTVARAQQALATTPSTMAGRSAAPCGSRLIQATPTKATTRPATASGFMVSPSIFQANSAVNGIHSWVATTSGLSDLARPKAT
jgi:hypothetical protein